MSEWQPIKTAPKDGTIILLTGGQETLAGYWEQEHAPAALIGRGWQVYWHPTAKVPDRRPTHWMPLPAPPEAA